MQHRCPVRPLVTISVEPILKLALCLVEIFPRPSLERLFGVTLCVCASVCSDRTLDAVAYPSVMLAMSVRRHASVLIVGEE